MFRALSHRPLFVAGISVLVATLWGSHYGAPYGSITAGWTAVRWMTGGILVICTVCLAHAQRISGWSMRLRPPYARAAPTLVVAAVAAWAGLQAGNAVFSSSRSAEEARRRWSIRDPPIGLITADLLVREAGENPWTGRAWIVGVRADGTCLRCSWPGTVPPGIGAGVHVRATGRLSLPREPTNPGQRDWAAALARDGIAGRLYLKSPKNLEHRGGTASAWRKSLRRIRRTAAQRLRARLSAADAGVACALLLGWRTGLSAQDRLRFERTGTMHLLAISGMHLLLVAGLAHACARRFGAGVRAASACALVGALIYVPIAGAGAPVRRAALVLTTHAIAVARGRIPDPASSLGGALIALVLLDPIELYRLGFWLSFLAAAAIAALASRWNSIWSERRRLLARFPAVQRDRPLRLRLARYVCSGLAVSLAASCATQPLIAWQFRIVTPLSPFTNLLAAPFVTVLMPLVAVQAAGVDAVAPLVGGTLAALRAVLDVCAAIPGACAAVPRPDPVAIGIWMLGLIVLIRHPRTGVAVLAIALLCAWPASKQRPASFLLLDVGHGQAALLQDRSGRAVLIDAGSRNRPGVGRTVVLPALREAGISELDCCVCTHGDADHWRGLLPLFGRIRIGELVVGQSVAPLLLDRAREHGIPVRRVATGTTFWRGDGATLTALADGRGMISPNDQSLVLLVGIGNHRMLLPADREAKGVRALLDRTLPRCAVMLAPHHGAAFRPLTPARTLGRAVRPQWVLTSAAHGFPDPSTLAAYGPLRWSTDRHGALRLTVRRDGSLALRPTRGHGATIAGHD